MEQPGCSSVAVPSTPSYSRIQLGDRMASISHAPLLSAAVVVIIIVVVIIVIIIYFIFYIFMPTSTKPVGVNIKEKC